MKTTKLLAILTLVPAIAFAQSSTKRLNLLDGGAQACASGQYSLYEEGGTIKKCVDGVETDLSGSGTIGDHDHTGGAGTGGQISDSALSSAVSSTKGGTGQNWSSSTGLPKVDGGTFSLLGVTDNGIPVANGTTVQLKTLSDCDGATSAVTFDDATNTFGCNTISGSGTPGGSTTQIQFNDGGAFGGDADITWDKTNNRLSIQNAAPNTTATTPPGVWVRGALSDPASGILTQGAIFSFTTSGTDSDGSYGGLTVNLGAGHTGTSSATGLIVVNNTASSNSGIQLNSSNINGNVGLEGEAIGASTAGLRIGGFFESEDSTGQNISVLAKAVDTPAGSNIAVLGNAANSTEATDMKNVGIYGTLRNSLFSGVNGSYAGLFDGGTLPDANSNVARFLGTMPSSPSGTAYGVFYDLISAGSASQTNRGVGIQYDGGYTGSSPTHALFVDNQAESTATTLNLAGATAPQGNAGILANGSQDGTGRTGNSFGVIGQGFNSAASNFGVFGKATDDDAGSNFGVFGNAANSTEATDLKNVAGYFTTRGTLITGSNISAALIADNASTEDIIRGYDAGTLVFQLTDGGGLKTTGGATGQSVTASVRDSGGVADCNLVFTNGLLTSTTC